MLSARTDGESEGAGADSDVVEGANRLFTEAVDVVLLLLRPKNRDIFCDILSRLRVGGWDMTARAIGSKPQGASQHPFALSPPLPPAPSVAPSRRAMAPRRACADSNATRAGEITRANNQRWSSDEFLYYIVFFASAKIHHRLANTCIPGTSTHLFSIFVNISESNIVKGCTRDLSVPEETLQFSEELVSQLIAER
jgi:hypothetical protein